MQASRTTSAVGSDTVGATSPSSWAKCQKLNELATSKLTDILTHVSAGAVSWQGYKESEVIAARQLLNDETQLPKH